MYVSEEVSKRVYTVLSVILYVTWLTISALCGSYHAVLAMNTSINIWATIWHTSTKYRPQKRFSNIYIGRLMGLT